MRNNIINNNNNNNNHKPMYLSFVLPAVHFFSKIIDCVVRHPHNDRVDIAAGEDEA